MKAVCPFCKKEGRLRDETKDPTADMAIVYSPDDNLYYVECRNCWTIGYPAVLGSEAINWFLMGKEYKEK